MGCDCSIGFGGVEGRYFGVGFKGEWFDGVAGLKGNAPRRSPVKRERVKEEGLTGGLGRGWLDGMG